MGLSFIAPLIALYLSALFLGEPITRRALGASLIALLGVGWWRPGG
jgi:S-adenosylmethionine uptake transporter